MIWSCTSLELSVGIVGDLTDALMFRIALHNGRFRRSESRAQIQTCHQLLSSTLFEWKMHLTFQISYLQCPHFTFTFDAFVYEKIFCIGHCNFFKGGSIHATDLYLKMALLRLKRSTLISLGHICQNLFHTRLKFHCSHSFKVSKVYNYEL